MTGERYGEPVGENEVAGLVVVLKAMIMRAGGKVELDDDELRAARELTVQIDATPAALTLRAVEGVPPDVPRFAA